MSKVSYKWNPSATRTVKYAYYNGERWIHGKHVCFEKTDEDAIKSCYESIVQSFRTGFHITEIVTKIT